MKKLSSNFKSHNIEFEQEGCELAIITRFNTLVEQKLKNSISNFIGYDINEENIHEFLLERNLHKIHTLNELN